MEIAKGTHLFYELSINLKLDKKNTKRKIIDLFHLQIDEKPLDKMLVNLTVY